MLRESIKVIKGIGEYYTRVLIQNGVRTCADLLWLFPKQNIVIPITEKVENTPQRLAMNVVIKSVVVKTGARKMTSVVAANSSGQDIHINFFSHSKLFFKGSKICVYGEVKNEYGRLNMTHPKWIYGHQTNYNESDYSLDKVPGAIIKKSVMTVLDSIKNYHEWLPQNILQKKAWSNLIESFRVLQTSNDACTIQKAKDRLCFEEALSYLLGLHMAQQSALRAGDNYKLEDHDLSDIVQKFGFELTPCQAKSWESIKNDLLSTKQMLRVLYGDVGSGKTLIAALGLILAYRSGRQSAFLVPTEILAKQHYDLLKKLLPDGNIVLLTGSTRSAKVYAKIKDEVCIIVGTHALLQSKVEYNKLGLLVIDEQHRFGVLQRMAIDANLCYNVLLMTATPIPRTLQLSLNNSIDVSQILFRPQKHRNINVELIYKLNELVEQVKHFIDNGENVFWVCPLIQKSEVRNVMDVTTRAEYLQSIFGDIVGVVHGKLSYANKESVLKKFYDKEYRILVSTTVIEVGINIPHANVMVIENPELFGLAQLYQLMGRVGRGEKPGYCFLYHGFISNEAKDRLRALQTCKSGLELAEHDMYLRGSGNILGIEQSGETFFHLLDLQKDYPILEEAQTVLQHLLKQDNFDKTLLLDCFSYLYSPWSGG